uniref:Pectinesterase 2 n=2 Tax=asterids TaxID=71274 RepID=AL11B_OLEEU|nr:RecName: Full=Pectinesterase 2; AltName: Full=Pollen allergen Ole e 11.0102; Short=Ole e 11-2; AltName: Allergen=Ole e 11.0102; Flags: Precursor [Olea europaea]AAY88919.1 Ole e 11.0102 allergen precursor [Olea europaea]
MSCIAVEAVLLGILLYIPIVLSDDRAPIPANSAQLNSWFDGIIQPVAVRKATMDPALVTAEGQAKVIKLKSDGSGDFKSINEAIKSIPDDNTKRVILSFSPGNYSEKVKIGMYKHYITFYGEDPNNMPILVFGGTAAEYGTVDSATLIVESNYFSAVNLKIVNSAPRPDGKRVGAQAAALRISGDKASFYNVKIYGFQDTLCDDKGKHFYKDCYIEGTVDFIFGSGKSIFLNTELHAVPGDQPAIITAQARKTESEDTGYYFVNCRVTGGGAFLGRSWMPAAKVVFAYTEMGDAIHPEGWILVKPEHESTVRFPEYNNKGPGANMEKRAKFVKRLSDAEAKQSISLGSIEASKWLLPPRVVGLP